VRVPARGDRSYEVRVEPGALDRLGELCASSAPAHRYAIVADGRVAELYGDRVLAAFSGAGLGADLHRFDPGEASKTRGTWARLTDALLEAGHGRDSVVVGLGGGVAGDLAGFVAATYLRGVPVVQVPTSLLAMVDAAVGGKTGVDTPSGKNLVGAFHHPALVVADTEVLRTLPAEHVACGLAEAVKAGAVADADFLDWIEAEAPELREAEPRAAAELVRRAAALKAGVVEEDPEEAGRRAILNFGHTVGHALERLSDYRLLHGQAVAVGMRVEARLGRELGMTAPDAVARLDAALAACGHRTRLEPAWTAPAVLAAASTDKKGRAGTARIVLLDRPGSVARGADGSWTHPLEGASAEKALGAALRAASERADSRPRPPA